MASIAAVRAILRSTPSRSAAARIGAQVKAAQSTFRAPTKSPISRSMRFPVQASFCLDSMLPYHTVTASAVMTSMLSISGRNYWLLEGENVLRCYFS